MNSKIDLLIVGGGLAGGLTALKFALTHPESRVLLLEESPRLGGHHTWSFHRSDLTNEAFSWIEPLVTCSWTETEVKFPRLTRTIVGGYHSIRSEDFHRVISEKLGDSIVFGANVTQVTSTNVALENGKIYEAACVLDARGVTETPKPKLNGFQKFIGYDVLLEQPHGLKTPLIMDATVPQLDGFRFFYLLPWDESRLLVEETFYSDTPDLNSDRLARSIRSYIERRGWKIAKIEREERGVLPLPMTSDAIKTANEGEAIPIGMRGGFFHSTTGYSFSEAVRVAEWISTLHKATVSKGAIADITTDRVREGLTKFRRPFVSRQRFYRMLNRLLFYASEPGLRYTIFQKFYEHPDDLIARFYSGRTSWADRLRILGAKPPMSISRALKNLTERSIHERIGGSQ